MNTITIVHDPTAQVPDQFNVEPHSDAAKAAIDAIRHWASPEDLVRFAKDRHGYQNTDGWFGITYPADVNPGEAPIPDGFVEVQAGYGDPHAPEHRLAESQYLDLLRQYLSVSGHPELAMDVPVIPGGGS